MSNNNELEDFRQQLASIQTLLQSHVEDGEPLPVEKVRQLTSQLMDMKLGIIKCLLNVSSNKGEWAERAIKEAKDLQVKLNNGML